MISNCFESVMGNQELEGRIFCAFVVVWMIGK